MVGKGRILSISLIALFSTVAYSVLGIVKFARFRTGIYDLVIFDQVVRDYSRFRAPGSLVKGQWNDLGEPLSIFNDHVSPILALLSPLYWIHDGPETLLVAQAALFSAAAIPLWVFVRRQMGAVAAYAVSTAYLVSWPIAEAASFHFHEFAFMPLLVALSSNGGRRAARSTCSWSRFYSCASKKTSGSWWRDSGWRCCSIANGGEWDRCSPSSARSTRPSRRRS
ncbi:hypothetical protein Misp02_66610 [Microtetraspora sp. NBRC 16547]|nr:DUF2079 domain-containing protein [Microtetraspora sp. NBRC 16547]GLX02575.1 hypothetical protein Misp02_66610 [Microtetraspora sp. NBRC 16547]